MKDRDEEPKTLLQSTLRDEINGNPNNGQVFKNKTNLIEFLLNDWRNDVCHTTMLEGKIVFVNVGCKFFRIEVRNLFIDMSIIKTPKFFFTKYLLK